VLQFHIFAFDGTRFLDIFMFCFDKTFLGYHLSVC
jgi:hypothetical protein